MGCSVCIRGRRRSHRQQQPQVLRRRRPRKAASRQPGVRPTPALWYRYPVGESRNRDVSATMCSWEFHRMPISQICKGLVCRDPGWLFFTWSVQCFSPLLRDYRLPKVRLGRIPVWSATGSCGEIVATIRGWAITESITVCSLTRACLTGSARILRSPAANR